MGMFSDSEGRLKKWITVNLFFRREQIDKISSSVYRETNVTDKSARDFFSSLFLSYPGVFRYCFGVGSTRSKTNRGTKGSGSLALLLIGSRMNGAGTYWRFRPVVVSGCTLTGTVSGGKQE